MPAVSDPVHWTAALVRELPDDGKRYECIDGELLVTPSPRWKHQDAVGAVYRHVYGWLQQEPIGKVTMSPADVEIVLGDLVQPDVFVVPLNADGSRPREWHEIRSLLLAVEVLSPSTARYDRITKRRFFARAGVPEYWIVDVDARLIERWTPVDDRPEILGEDVVLQWSPPGARVPFRLPLADFFAEILADHPGE